MHSDRNDISRTLADADVSIPLRGLDALRLFCQDEGVVTITRLNPLAGIRCTQTRQHPQAPRHILVSIPLRGLDALRPTNNAHQWLGGQCLNPLAGIRCTQTLNRISPYITRIRR